MAEDFPTILECLGREGHRLFEIEKTPNGIKVVELCDEYYGATLSWKQLRRLIEELTQILESADEIDTGSPRGAD
ncbi:hypothetical protein [uncultured Tateyamaria sp.]|uniref:hypothetical protein n=1 Tax=uncultured Tateyamaria sp. TaxID=455651 RepID=UPI00260C5EAC|nr:hypothetical protein [uncultured Tateyamaria sp.]